MSGVGHYDKLKVQQFWQRKLLLFLEHAKKNADLQGSTLSGHHMTTGFGTFEPSTCAKNLNSDAKLH